MEGEFPRQVIGSEISGARKLNRSFVWSLSISRLFPSVFWNFRLPHIPSPGTVHFPPLSPAFRGGREELDVRKRFIRTESSDTRNNICKYASRSGGRTQTSRARMYAGRMRGERTR